MTPNFKKHLSMILVVLCSSAAGMNIMLGKTGLSLLMGFLAGWNIVATFYWAKKEVLNEINNKNK